MGKKRKKMKGHVDKIIKSVVPRVPDKAQISVPEADDLYREIRVENVVTDEHGEKAQLKQGAEVDVDRRSRFECDDKETHRLKMSSRLAG